MAPLWPTRRSFLSWTVKEYSSRDFSAIVVIIETLKAERGCREVEAVVGKEEGVEEEAVGID